MTSRYPVLLVVALAACGNRAEPSSPASPSATSPAATASEAPAAAASAEPATHTPKKRRPLDLYNACGRVVTVILGPDPKAADAGRRTVAPSATIDLARDAEGNQTVWLADEKGEPMPTKVHISRGMTKIEVGRSCSTLNAH